MNPSMANRRVLSAWIGMVVIMLLLQGSGALQAIHLDLDHDHSESDHSSCSLCLLLHAAISLPPAPEPIACLERAITLLLPCPVRPDVCDILPLTPARGPPLS